MCFKYCSLVSFVPKPEQMNFQLFSLHPQYIFDPKREANVNTEPESDSELKMSSN